MHRLANKSLNAAVRVDLNMLLDQGVGISSHVLDDSYTILSAVVYNARHHSFDGEELIM